MRILTLTEWETRVSEVYSQVRNGHLSFLEEQELRQKYIFTELGRQWKNKRGVYASYTHGYVYGLMRAEHNDLHRNHLEFCYKGQTGELFSTHKKSSHRTTEVFYAEDRGHELGLLPRGFYWRETDKLYYCYEI